MTKLHELATTLRSKNAGVNQVTFDIIFRDAETYQRVLRSEQLNPARIAEIYRITPERISDYVTFDLANAIKFTIYRKMPNGSPGDWDVLGCQYYGPLMELEIA